MRKAVIGSAAAAGVILIASTLCASAAERGHRAFHNQRAIGMTPSGQVYCLNPVNVPGYGRMCPIDY